LSGWLPARNGIAQPVIFCFAGDELEGKLQLPAMGSANIVPFTENAVVSQYH
jgi:hypothetical protein